MRLYYIVKIIQICFILMAMAAVIYIDPFCHQDPLDVEVFESLMREKVYGKINQNILDGKPQLIGDLEINNRAEGNIKGISNKDPGNDKMLGLAMAIANRDNSKIQTSKKIPDSMIPDNDHLDHFKRSEYQSTNNDDDLSNAKYSTPVNEASSEGINYFEVTPAALKSESPVAVETNSEITPEGEIEEDDVQKHSHIGDTFVPRALPTEDSSPENTSEDTGNWFSNFFSRHERDVLSAFNMRDPIDMGRTIIGTFRCEKIDIWSFNGLLISSGNIYQDVAARRHFASIGLFAHLIVAVYHFLCHYFTKVPFSQSVNRAIAVFSAFIWICIGSWSLYEYVCWDHTFTKAPFTPNLPPFYLLILLYSIIAIFILAIEIIDHKGLFANIAVDEVFPTGYSHAPQTEAEYIKSVIEQIEMANIAPENVESNEFETKNGVRAKPLEVV